MALVRAREQTVFFRRSLALGILALVLWVPGCSGEGGAAPGGVDGAVTPRATIPGLAADSTPATQPPPGAASKQGCEAKPAGPAGAVPDRGGPYYHSVVVADTRDGLTLSNDRLILEHASVPDGVKRADGSVYIYYVNGANHGVFVARLDGATATVLGPVTVDGVERPTGMVDPDATLLPDGKVRLAYLNSFGPVSGPGAKGEFVMCLADSVDGINFTTVARAIAFDVVTTDPSLVGLDDGSWLMALSQGERSVLARSADGLTFEQYLSVDYGGVPELALLPGGKVRIYACAREGMVTATTGDGGRTWAREGRVAVPRGYGKIACDPSLVAGANLFVFKVAD